MTGSSVDPPAVVSSPDGDDRLWVSEWYRIAPRTFEQFELFFEPGTVYAVFAEESFKSLLLRRDGRARAARDLGDRYRSATRAQLLDGERSFEVPADEMTAIRLTPGSLLTKPRLTIETSARDHTLYHGSRSYDVESLCRSLDRLYADSHVDVATADRDWLAFVG
ncbi:hypothetical protein [Haloplanus halophilus]|uniref:hypothetical protein n=1 Tax=Haloplanus halophilus TaxID=2949993 RepID=UPI002041878C|nr:hypothetical protein [Haloplanus sp. GDY1]